MPRRNDLKRVLVIGSGPIVIGQACEFDYSGSQACKALRSEGLEVVRLVRTQIGPIKLGELRPGRWRTLTPGELKTLLAPL